MQSNQFSLRSLLLVVICFAAACAMVTTGNEFVQLIAAAVVGANVLGYIAALFVTHGLKMPRDGSYRIVQANNEPSELKGK